jgi:hypothetical protein
MPSFVCACTHYEQSRVRRVSYRWRSTCSVHDQYFASANDSARSRSRLHTAVKCRLGEFQIQHQSMCFKDRRVSQKAAITAGFKLARHVARFRSIGMGDMDHPLWHQVVVWEVERHQVMTPPVSSARRGRFLHAKGVSTYGPAAICVHLECFER